MTRPGWRTVLLREEVVSRLEKVKEQKEAGRPRKIPLGALIEDLIWPILESDELLRKYSPYLSEFSIDDDKILLRDNRINEIMELTFRNDVLYCSHDRSDNCVHIGFAWSIPKVYKVMIAHGQKMPKVKKA